MLVPIFDKTEGVFMRSVKKLKIAMAYIIELISSAICINRSLIRRSMRFFNSCLMSFLTKAMNDNL